MRVKAYIGVTPIVEDDVKRLVLCYDGVNYNILPLGGGTLEITVEDGGIIVVRRENRILMSPITQKKS